MNLSGLACSKDLGIQYNVTFRIIDEVTGKIVSEHIGHNQATNSLLTGIAHYLKGDGILNQAQHMLSRHIPMYMSLGTMGLTSQEEDENGLPLGIGPANASTYIGTMPGYGADGYDANRNNNRKHMGLGPKFAERPTAHSETPLTIDCELVSDTFPRSPITYREIIPESHAELSETIDIVFSAMISTGALAQFREAGKDYVFITEAGLWSTDVWTDTASNGLLAGYRIAPPDEANWHMVVKDGVSSEEVAQNIELLRRSILKVRKNQVVQVIWKIQLGSHRQLIGERTHCDCTCPSSTCPCHGKPSGGGGGDQPEPPAPTIPTQVNILEDYVAGLLGDPSGQLSLQVSCTATGGEYVDWYPENPTDPIGILWTSNNPGAVIVNELTGEYTIQGAGRATIRATATDGSGAFDECVVEGDVDLPIDDTLQSYALFSAGDVYLGANNTITAQKLAIQDSLVWEASGGGGLITGPADAQLYVLGTHLPCIVSNGNNYFDIDTYLSSTNTSAYKILNTSGDAFMRSIYPALDYTPPQITTLSIVDVETKQLYRYNEATPGHVDLRDESGGFVAIITEECAKIYTREATAENDVVDPPPKLSTGDSIPGLYLFETIVPDDALVEYVENGEVKYKAVKVYGKLHCGSSREKRATVYIEPGNYAFSQILQTGNWASINLVNANPDSPTLIYVDGEVSFTNDAMLNNPSNARSALIYCAHGDFECGNWNNLRMYVEAPEGTITIGHNTTVKGCLYAAHIITNNNVVIDVE